eukprot:2092200-Rhodomonas_salina.3
MSVPDMVSGGCVYQNKGCRYQPEPDLDSTNAKSNIGSARWEVRWERSGSTIQAVSSGHRGACA